MAIAAATDAEPAPGQFPGKRGKIRSWERGIVYDPEKQSLEIKKIKKIEEDSDTKYLRCALPSSSNVVNVFLNSNESGNCEVTTKGGEGEGNIFIGRLSLEKLGVRDTVSRVFGQLKTLYIVKSSVS